ncbi:MAG: hypothetical protein JW723_11355 [Bacteroidales bacterium]|nr:hypothetical protein [Bacteroidales bacterium]
MKPRSIIIISAIVLFVAAELTGQDTVNFKNIFTTGISVEYGIGHYSVKDEFISKEKYTGILPCYSIEWARFHHKNGYRLKFEYRISNNIKNNNISAEAKQFAFNQDFIYPVGSFSLLTKNIYIFLGPSIQYFYYDIKYDFVKPGTFIGSKTYGSTGSLGLNAAFIYQISAKLKIDGSLRSNLFSVSGKVIDEELFEETSPRFLTFLTTTKFDFDFYLHYNLFYKISVSLGYKFDLSRINKWNPYIAASDNLIIKLNYKF